jgi:hypothetical protein
MKKLVLLAFVVLMGLSVATWGNATVQLNGTLFYYASSQSPPACPGVNIRVQVLGGPSATRLAPVVDSQGNPITMLVGSDGHFDGGVGIVPGIADNGVATFQVIAWGGDVLTPAPSESQSFLWTQQTGSWNSKADPPQPLSGPPLAIPGGNIIYRGGVGRIAIVPPSSSGPLDRWSVRASGTGQWLSSIVYGNNTFVAVGSAGTVLTSVDGSYWTSMDPGTTNNLLGIARGANTFVAVGSSGTVLTSADSTNWTRINSGTTYDLGGVAYGNNTFVAVVWSQTPTVLTSTNGTNWTERSLQGTVSFPPARIIYGNDRFLTSSLEEFATSPDGTHWTRKYWDWDYPVGGSAAGNSRFVTVGGWYFYISTDGNTWCKWGGAYVVETRNITFGADTFLAVGGRTNGLIMSSKEGINWTSHSPGTNHGLIAVAYGNDTFVAVGEAGTVVQSAPVHPTGGPAALSGGFSGGSFELTLAGTVGHSYLSQSADDLSGNILWHTLATLTLTNSPFTWRDLTATNHSWRFYRALTQPREEMEFLMEILSYSGRRHLT